MEKSTPSIDRMTIYGLEESYSRGGKPEGAVRFSGVRRSIEEVLQMSGNVLLSA